MAKLSNKYIDILFKSRKLVDEGTPVESVRNCNFVQLLDPFFNFDDSLDISFDSDVDHYDD